MNHDRVRATNYSPQAHFTLIVPRFNTCYKKDSVAHRGSVLWNTVLNRRCEKLGYDGSVRSPIETDREGHKYFAREGTGESKYMQLAFVLEKR